jgi:hypothetical protein
VLKKCISQRLNKAFILIVCTKFNVFNLDQIRIDFHCLDCLDSCLDLAVDLAVGLDCHPFQTGLFAAAALLVQSLAVALHTNLAVDLGYSFQTGLFAALLVQSLVVALQKDFAAVLDFHPFQTDLVEAGPDFLNYFDRMVDLCLVHNLQVRSFSQEYF